MKVLHVTSRADTGGGPEHVLQLVRNMEAGVEHFIASPDERPYHPRYRAEVGPDHVINIPHRKLKLRAVVALARFVRKNGINIIHSHGKGAGVYGRLVSAACGVKSIHTFHGLHVGEYGYVKRKLYLTYERILSSRTAAGIAVSRGERLAIRESGAFPDSKLFVIPNGVTEPTDQIARNDDLMRTIRIAAVNRFDYQKNPEALIDIAESLMANSPERAWHLYIYGDGKGRDEIARRIQSRGLAHQVSLEGSVPNMRDVLRSSDIFLSSSRWEGLPIAVLEAMSEGVPPVVSDVVGNRDIVTHEADGYLYDLSRPVDAARFVETLLDAKVRTAIGREAAATVRRQYSASTMSRKTRDIYFSQANTPFINAKQGI